MVNQVCLRQSCWPKSRTEVHLAPFEPGSFEHFQISTATLNKCSFLKNGTDINNQVGFKRHKTPQGKGNVLRLSPHRADIM